MAILINDLKLTLEEDETKLKEISAKELKINLEDIKEIKILRESLDARKENIILVYKVLVELADNIIKDESKIIKKSRSKKVKLYKKNKKEIKFGKEKLKNPIVIIGTGPAGLFAGYTLAKYGYNPVIIERGMEVDKRKKEIEKFWTKGKLNPNCNIQFGEGGAGTFSDGKLTTRVKDSRIEEILEVFIRNGAPKEIAYSHKPHIGTDILIKVIESLRKEIIKNGGEFHFSTKLEDIKKVSNCLKSIVLRNLKDDKIYECNTENLILAIGHSARDTYEMLYDNKIGMVQKPFAIGVRIEHPQKIIDENQYGKYKDHSKLKSSEYKLTYRAKSGRACYSFCMCPGGTVVASASEEGYLAINGMSEYSRDKENANSAIIVSVKEEDFESDHPLSGMEFQRKYEKLAFELSEKTYKAPVQLFKDFKEGKESKNIGEIVPSHTGGYLFKDLNKCLPEYVSETIKEAIEYFDKKIKGFAREDSVLTGIETRTSAPLRILRDENFESNIIGIYPIGEGAGYAGGIVSAAIDGIKIAEKIIEKYSNEFS